MGADPDPVPLDLAAIRLAVRFDEPDLPVDQNAPDTPRRRLARTHHMEWVAAR